MSGQRQLRNREHETKVGKDSVLSRTKVYEALKSLNLLNILIIGDACLDVYWHADMKLSELSMETPHFPLPVVEERFSPGGCANAAACLCALGVGSVRLLTAIGPDWRGQELLRECTDHGIDTSAVVHSPLLVTPAYCKPVRKGISDIAYEDPRIDFENRKPLPEESEAELVKRLREAATGVDAIAVSDQLRLGVITPAVREALSSLAQEGMLVVVDSRARIGLFKNAITKPNEYECLAAVGRHPSSDRTPSDIELAEIAAQTLSERTGAPVCMTAGPRGALWATASESTLIPGVPVTPPIDTVGAGDCFLSALTAALAAGCTGTEAASLANLASAVTVKKLHTTGTATPDEIISIHRMLTAEEVSSK